MLSAVGDGAGILRVARSQLIDADRID